MKTHGMSNTKIYNVWKGMRRRCYLKSDSRYSRYGGRGIKVCAEWNSDFTKFYEWAIKNGYRENAGLSIDRVDVDGNYEPSNCRWVDNKTQMNNMSSNNRLTFKGEELTMSEWSDRLNIPYATIQARIMSYGWSVERALSTPHYKDNKRGLKDGAGVYEDDKRFKAMFSMKTDEENIKHVKSFSKNKYGYEQAKKLAIKQRKEWEKRYWYGNQ